MLPWLEGMSWAAATKTPKPRMCFNFFHYGVPMPPDGHAERLKHGWFPVGAGRDFKFTGTHASLEKFRDKLTYFGGLSVVAGFKPVAAGCRRTPRGFVLGVVCPPHGVAVERGNILVGMIYLCSVMRAAEFMVSR